MSEYQASPLHWPAGWPRRSSTERERARFSAKSTKGWQRQVTVAEARVRLMKEITAMTKAGHKWRANPNHVVVSTNLRTRNDGHPYSNAAEPNDPGVCVYFVLDGEQMAMPCDKWDRVADNIAAIAAHIGAMRSIERWGVADLKAAFAGFRELPAPDGSKPTARHVHWSVVLGVPGDSSTADVKAAYRRKRSAAHSDRDGDTEDFIRVQEAWSDFCRERNL